MWILFEIDVKGAWLLATLFLWVGEVGKIDFIEPRSEQIPLCIIILEILGGRIVIWVDQPEKADKCDWNYHI